jgi:hypothetical protein
MRFDLACNGSIQSNIYGQERLLCGVTFRDGEKVTVTLVRNRHDTVKMITMYR